MKKFFVMLVSMALLVSVAVAPVWAAGGKNHGDVGQGEVDQGDIGSETGQAPGSDAQGNQS